MAPADLKRRAGLLAIAVRQIVSRSLGPHQYERIDYRFRLKRRSTGQEFIEHDPECIHINGRTDLPIAPACLLRRHVIWGAEKGAAPRLAGLLPQNKTRQAEVGDLENEPVVEDEFTIVARRRDLILGSRSMSGGGH
jgi:hypothetical protein